MKLIIEANTNVVIGIAEEVKFTVEGVDEGSSVIDTGSTVYYGDNEVVETDVALPADFTPSKYKYLDSKFTDNLDYTLALDPQTRIRMLEETNRALLKENARLNEQQALQNADLTSLIEIVLGGA